MYGSWFYIPPLDETITTNAKITMIQSVMGKAMYKGRAKTLSAFDSKSFYTIFVRGCGIIPA
jgi:hypothetical protein